MSGAAPGFAVNTTQARTQTELLSHVCNQQGWKELKVAKEKGSILWLVRAEDFDNKLLEGVKPNQRVSRIAGMAEICNKASFAQALKRCKDEFPEHYKFWPRTWVVPDDLSALESKKRIPTLIFKPDEGTQGDGIYIVQSVADLKRKIGYLKDAKSAIVQRYISDPLTLDGKKFDFRVYVCVLGVDPFRIYLCREGIVRFCSDDYEKPNPRNLHRATGHLTNYSLNKVSQNFVHGEDGSKRLLSAVFETLEKQCGVDTSKLWGSICDLVMRTMVAIQPTLVASTNAAMSTAGTGLPQPHGAGHKRPQQAVNGGGVSNDSFFQILGFDVLLDAQARPYLLEVNNGPSLRVDTVYPIEDPRNLAKQALQKTLDAAGAKCGPPAAPPRARGTGTAPAASKPQPQAGRRAVKSGMGVKGAAAKGGDGGPGRGSSVPPSGRATPSDPKPFGSGQISNQPAKGKKVKIINFGPTRSGTPSEDGVKPASKRAPAGASAAAGYRKAAGRQPPRARPGDAVGSRIPLSSAQGGIRRDSLHNSPGSSPTSSPERHIEDASCEGQQHTTGLRRALPGSAGGSSSRRPAKRSTLEHEKDAASDGTSTSVLEALEAVAMPEGEVSDTNGRGRADSVETSFIEGGLIASSTLLQPATPPSKASAQESTDGGVEPMMFSPALATAAAINSVQNSDGVCSLPPWSPSCQHKPPSTTASASLSARLLSETGDPGLDCARNAVTRALTGMLSGSGAGEARQHGGIGALVDPVHGIVGIDGAKPKLCRCMHHFKTHVHVPCEVDLIAKSAAVTGTLQLVKRMQEADGASMDDVSSLDEGLTFMCPIFPVSHPSSLISTEDNEKIHAFARSGQNGRHKPTHDTDDEDAD